MNTSKRTLLDGRTAGKAFEEQKEAYEEGVCRVAKVVRKNVLLKEFYMWNEAHYVLLGNGEARIAGPG